MVAEAVKNPAEIRAELFGFVWREDRGCYEYLTARVGDDFRLELSVSPTGRSKQVWINNVKVWPR